MKNFIKALLGKDLVYHISNFKNKVIQNKNSRFQAEEMERVREFYSRFIKKGDLCFDVGANMGNKVEPMLGNNARVIAIEPQESCQKFLRKKFKNNIVLIPKGLGSQEEIKDFFISDSNTISSFSRDWIDAVKKNRFKNHEWNKVKKIEIITLDNLIEIYGIPAFIKIDVEGYELEVLKGLSRPVGMISFEYTVPEQTHKSIECINVIRSNNYSIECNFTVGDKMEFVLSKWQNSNDFIKTIESAEFINTGLGDIYVRTKFFPN
jgi:FkbM family methyltransferase